MSVAILSSGTDHAGINSVIRAVVRRLQPSRKDIYGFRWGFKGLLEDSFVKLDSRGISGQIGKAGCFLGTGRPELYTGPGKNEKIMERLISKKIEHLVVIGGRHSIEIARDLHKIGTCAVTSIPATIQDDIWGTDECLGVDSALNMITRCVEIIRSCESSRNRTFLVEVEGKDSGLLALKAQLATGAEFALIPEDPEEDVMKVGQKILDLSKTGKPKVITLISRGWKPGTAVLAKYLEERTQDTKLFVRETTLGYVQRGGPPTVHDRFLGTEFGEAAALNVLNGVGGMMIGIQNNKIVNVPMEKCAGKLKTARDGIHLIPILKTVS